MQQPSADAAASRNIACAHCDTINRVALARPAQEARCGKCKRSLFAGKPLELTGANFATHVERSALPVVIDLWAPWCAPCRMMAPVIERAAAALEPKLRVAKLNTETEPDLAARFGVRGIPAFIVLREGKEVARRVGAIDYGEFMRWASNASD